MRRLIRSAKSPFRIEIPLRSALRTVIVLAIHALGAFTAALPAFASPADVARARELLVEAATAAESIHDTGFRSDALREIAAAQARAGDETAALITAGSAGRSAWRSVAIGFAAGGNIPAALAAAALVEPEPLEWVLGVTSRDEALLQVVQTSAQRNDILAASVVLRLITSPVFAGIAEAAVAEAHARAGDAREAAAGFRRASLYAELSRFSLLRSAAPAAVYRAIGQARGRLGDRAEAIAAFDKALENAGRDPREDRRDCVIAGIGAERAIAGDFDGAMRTLTLVRDPQQTLVARAALARSLAAVGEYDRAMEVARHPYSDTGRMKAFIEVATVASSRGHTDVAARAYEAAIAAAEKRPADRGSSSFSFRDEALLEPRARARTGPKRQPRSRASDGSSHRPTD